MIDTSSPITRAATAVIYPGSSYVVASGTFGFGMRCPRTSSLCEFTPYGVHVIMRRIVFAGFDVEFADVARQHYGNLVNLVRVGFVEHVECERVTFLQFVETGEQFRAGQSGMPGNHRMRGFAAYGQ